VPRDAGGLMMRTVSKKARRAARERELGRKQLALPDKKYNVIVADPEWRFEPWSRETGMDRAADNHYPTSVLDVIKSRDVASIAADDCVLFLWATVPMLPHAIGVMGSWGFSYRSHYIWAKDKIGLGYWNRNKHELLLIGTRGNIPAPAPGTQWHSVIEAPRGAHSEKPDIFLRMIEEYYPSLPKIELNRRGPALVGWDAWGNEAQYATASIRDRDRRRASA
jgi:N6-adenosine-specific RNA methylase IME4